MKNFAKIIVTILVVVVTLFLFSLVNVARTNAGYSTSGFWGYIVLSGGIGAVAAIWKKNKDKGGKANNKHLDDNSSSILQK